MKFGILRSDFWEVTVNRGSPRLAVRSQQLTTNGNFRYNGYLTVNRGGPQSAVRPIMVRAEPLTVTLLETMQDFRVVQRLPHSEP